MRLLWLTIWMVGALFSIAEGQAELYATKLDTKDGLPSSTIYYLFQDSKGFIWIGTDKGVVKYNGTDFEYYTSRDGLTNNNVFFIREDPQTGYIWFNAFKGGLCYYDGTKILPHPLNTAIKEKLDNNWVTSFAIDEEGCFWFTSTNRNKREILDLDYNFYKIPFTQDTIVAISPDSTSCMAISNRTYIKRCDHSSVLIAGNVGISTHPKATVTKTKLSLEEDFLQNGIRKAIVLENHKILANTHTELLIFDENKVEIYWNNPFGKLVGINQTYQTNDETIFVCTNIGVAVLDKNYQLKKWLLQGYPISHALQDQDGNYWFSTLNDGLFVVSSLGLKQYWTNERIDYLEFGTDSTVWVSTHNNKLYGLAYQAVGETWSSINDSLSASKRTAKDRLLLYFLRQPREVKSLAWTNKDQLMIGYFNGFEIYDTTSFTPSFSSKDNGFKWWTKAIAQDANNQFWMGTMEGLFMMPSLEHKAVQIELGEQVQQPSIHDIKTTALGQLLVATAGDGLAILEGEEWYWLTQKEGLSSNFVHTIWVEHDSSIWLGTNRGVNHLKGNLRKPSIDCYNTNNGFPINDVRLIKKSNNNLWVGGNKGLILLKDGVYTKKGQYQTYLHHLEVNNKIVAQKAKYTFNHQENNLIFHIRTIRFNQQEEYYYRLIGIDTTWKKSNIPSIPYNELPYGKYAFQTKANLKSPVLEIPFTIKPAFTQTWGFRLLCFGGGLLLLIGGGLLVLRYLNQKTVLQRRMKDLENKALRSQMNPHFIFNSMNSIMFLIVNNEPKQARRYLSKFSKLMRSVLENSKYNFIPLEEELATLKAYLALEELRYGDQVAIHLEVASDLEEHLYQIPPMLLQPIIENALMHGLAPKKGQGNLWLHFFEKREQLYVLIKDDGIGRKAAQEINTKERDPKQTSSALLSIEERIENINIIYQTTLAFSIKDLYENGQADGTEVVFCIPQVRHEKNKSSNY